VPFTLLHMSGSQLCMYRGYSLIANWASSITTANVNKVRRKRLSGHAYVPFKSGYTSVVYCAKQYSASDRGRMALKSAFERIGMHGRVRLHNLDGI
jgi:hypothetical protein